MDNLLGLLRIHVQRGVDLAVRDMRSSDPYIILKMGKQVTFAPPPFLFLFWFISDLGFAYIFDLETLLYIGLLNEGVIAGLSVSIFNLFSHMIVYAKSSRSFSIL